VHGLAIPDHNMKTTLNTPDSKFHIEPSTSRSFWMDAAYV
jgi:hypothetical protein